MPKLILIPTPLDEDGHDHLPDLVMREIKRLDIFIVERARTARRFIKKVIPDFDIDRASFIELDKHRENAFDPEEAFDGISDVGLLSEAGLPCLADPGSEVVKVARERGYIIKPLTGPSSVFLGLIASGMNGQAFTFHGYLPIKAPDLKLALQAIDRQVTHTNYSQIWIETPYRNNAVLKSVCEHVDAGKQLCICQNLTGNKETIRIKKIRKWRSVIIPKEPTIFILGG